VRAEARGQTDEASFSGRYAGVTIRTVENFKSDGTLDREDAGPDHKFYSKEPWEIKDGVLITVVVDGFPGKGTTIKGTVTSIDDKSQGVEMERGAVVKKARLKE
jgi:hypothetical protein